MVNSPRAADFGAGSHYVRNLETERAVTWMSQLLNPALRANAAWGSASRFSIFLLVEAPILHRLLLEISQSLE
jgi:hypothetical protein